MTDSTALCISKCLHSFVPGPFGKHLPVIWSTMEQRGTPFQVHFILPFSVSEKAADIRSALKEGRLLPSFNPDQRIAKTT